MNRFYGRPVWLKWEFFLLVLVLLVCASLAILSSQEGFSVNAMKNIGYMITKNSLISAREEFVANLPSSTEEEPLAFPRLDIFFSEQDMRSLTSNLPISMKDWKPGVINFLSFKGKMKFRLRGDANVTNYLYHRKSFKIKLPKGDQVFGIRRFSLLPANNSVSLNYTLGYLVAESLGVVTPVRLPVILSINGHRQGVYVFREDLNEQFLRNRNIMPVEIFKGDRAASTIFSSNLDYEQSLFENEATWEKQSSNNRIKANNYDALEQALSILWGNSKHPGYKLEEVFPVKYWARYALLMTLLRSNHQDNRHNQRMLFDDQLGAMVPIAFDLPYASNAVNSENKLLSFSNAPLAALVKSDEFLIEYFSLASLFLDRISKTGCVDQSLCFGQPRSTEQPTALNLHDEIHQYVSNVVINNFPNNLSALLAEPLYNFRRQLDTRPVRMTIDKYCTVVLVDRLDGIKTIRGIKYANSVKGRQQIEIELGAFPKRVTPVCSGFSTLAAECFGTTNGLELKPQPFLLNINGLEYDDFLANTYLGSEVRVDVTASANGKKWCEELNVLQKKSFLQPEKLQWSGEVVIDKPRYLYSDVDILPGTRIRIKEGASLIFKGKVHAVGTKHSPIVFEPAGDKPWGVIALIGKGTEGSVFDHCHFSGGSAWKDTMTAFLGMLSIHDTKNVQVSNCRLGHNVNADDAIHVVYSKAVRFKDVLIENALSDAVDIDISDQIELEKVNVHNAGNDCVDFMTSTASLKNYSFNGCGDKGISIGERSSVLSIGGNIANASTGIESKDESEVYLADTRIVATEIPLKATRKNSHYFAKGKILTVQPKRTYHDYGFAWIDKNQARASCSPALGLSGKYQIGMASESWICESF